MNPTQQPSPYPQPAPFGAAAPKPPRKGLPTLAWLGITLGALLVGACAGGVVGSAGAGATAEPVTETVTVTIDPDEARQAELDERAARLDLREEELDARADDLTGQEEEAAAVTTVGDGIWTVGVDIEPGTYRATDVGSDCYWAVLVSGTNGSDIVNNGIPGGGSPTVTVEEGHDFETSRCGEWTRQ